MFDQSRVPVPGHWEDAGIEWWAKAYHQSRFRGRVHTLISNDRTSSSNARTHKLE